MMANDPTFTVQTTTVPQAVVASSTEAAPEKTATSATSSEVKQASKQPSKNPNANVETKVREYFKDIPLMAEISKCESHFRQFEKDGSIFRGVVNDRDVGAMQINEYYHKDRAVKLGYDLHTLEGNMAYARLLYNEQGGQPWISSSPCWKKSLVAKAMYEPKEVAKATSAEVSVSVAAPKILAENK